MNHLSSLIEHYLEYCKYQKCLDKKTLKSYRIDLRQFSEHVPMTEVSAVTSSIIESYIASLHAQYQPKTVKRKRGKSCKQRFTRGYKRYKETSGLMEWKIGHIFHSIFT